MTTKIRKATGVVSEPSFFKWQLMSSKQLNVNPDVLDALLSDDKQYTLPEVDSLVKEFMKRKV